MTQEPKIFARAVRGVSLLSLQSALNALLGTALFMYVARVLSKEELGIYTSINIVIAISTFIAVAGMNAAIARFTSKLLGENKPSLASSTAKRILSLLLPQTIVVTAVLTALSPTLSRVMLGSEKYTYLFQLASLVVFASSLGTVADALLQGIGRFSRLASFRLASKVISVVIAAGLLTIGLGIVAPLIGSIVFSVGMTAFSITLASIELFRFSGRNNIPMKTLLAFSLPVMATNLLMFATDNLDKLVILHSLNVKTLGTYSVATTASSLIPLLIGIPILTVLMPSMSEAYGRYGISSVADSLRLSIRYISIIFIPLSLGLAALSPLAIKILAGSAYSEASLPLSIISLGLCAYGFFIVISAALTTVGETKKVMVAMASASVSELISALALTQLIGLLGAALSRTIMYSTLFITALALCSRIIPIQFKAKNIAKSLLVSSLVALCAYAFASFTSFSLLLLPIYLLAAMTFYLLIFSLTGTLNLKDIYLVASAVPLSIKLLDKIGSLIKSSPKLYRLVKWVLHE